MKSIWKYTLYFTIAIGTLQVCSCYIYKSTIPITKPSTSTINNNWIGPWIVLEENDSILWPIMEIDLQAFNENAYAATAEFYNKKGRRINSVNTFSVHHSKNKHGEYLNIRDLKDEKNNYFFYKIEQDLSDSILIRYLTDSLKVEFESSQDFKDFLEKEDAKPSNEFLSKPILFYRWNALNWNRVNKQNKVDQFHRFWSLGKIDEDDFLKLSDEKLNDLLIDKPETQIEKIQPYFNEIHLVNQINESWKAPNYGVIKLKSGKFVKLKFDLFGPLIKDLSNNLIFENPNERAWPF